MKEGQEKIYICGVRLDSVLGKSPFGDQIVQKGFGDSGEISGQV